MHQWWGLNFLLPNSELECDNQVTCFQAGKEASSLNISVHRKQPCDGFKQEALYPMDIW